MKIPKSQILNLNTIDQDGAIYLKNGGCIRLQQGGVTTGKYTSEELDEMSNWMLRNVQDESIRQNVYRNNTSNWADRTRDHVKKMYNNFDRRFPGAAELSMDTTYYKQPFKGIMNIFGFSGAKTIDSHITDTGYRHYKGYDDYSTPQGKKAWRKRHGYKPSVNELGYKQFFPSRYQQGGKVQKNLANFYTRLKERNLISPDTTQSQFAKLPLEEIDTYGRRYMQSINAYTPDDPRANPPGARIVSQTNYNIVDQQSVPGDTLNFDDAFRAARKAGKPTFSFDGKLYSTQLDPNAPKSSGRSIVRPGSQTKEEMSISELRRRKRKNQMGGNVQAEIEGGEYVFKPQGVSDVEFKMMDNTGKKHTSPFGFVAEGKKHAPGDSTAGGIKILEGDAYIASKHLGINGRKAGKGNPSVADLMVRNGGKALAEGFNGKWDKFGINKWNPNAVKHHLDLMTELQVDAELNKIKQNLSKLRKGGFIPSTALLRPEQAGEIPQALRNTP